MKNTITGIIIILLGVGFTVLRKPMVDLIIESRVRLFGSDLGGGAFPRYISYWVSVLIGLILIVLGFLTLTGVVKVK